MDMIMHYYAFLYIIIILYYHTFLCTIRVTGPGNS